MLEELVHPVYAVAAGVVLSLCYFLISTDNPARIPLYKVLFRSLFGILLYLITWLAITYPVYRVLLATLSSRWDFGGMGLFFFGVSVGLSFPIAIREGKNHLIGRHTARTYRLLTLALQFIDEVTSQYFGRIIMREERKASYEVLEGDDGGAERAVQRLFEFYIEEIAREEAKHLLPDRQAKVFNFVKVHSTAVKFKFLLRHLGYRNCVARVRAVQKVPESILPAWPGDEPDRRKVHDRRRKKGSYNPERRQRPYGRRKIDSPSVRDMILGRGSKQLPERRPGG